jgi:RNA polymerase primary sigma factor
MEKYMTREKETSESQDDILKSYFDQIRRTPLLSFEEELDLSRRVQAGDGAARDHLIKANLRLVVKMARQFSCPDVPLIDLIQEGNLGLIRAAQKYDHAKNVRFSTYASWWIKQAITRSLANKRRAIRIPHRKEEALKKIQRAYTVLSQLYSRQPSTEEIGKEIGMSAANVESILEMSNAMVSLDMETSIENGCLLDVYEDTTYAPDKEVLNVSVRDNTLSFLEQLMEKEKQILMYRFEFYNGRKYTLKKVGEELGISPETVRQIEIRALNKLRANADELKEYVYG